MPFSFINRKTWQAFAFLVLLCVGVVCIGPADYNFASTDFVGESANIIYRWDLFKKNRANKDILHDVVIACKQNNLDKILMTLYEVSNPHHRNYGRHHQARRSAIISESYFFQ